MAFSDVSLPQAKAGGTRAAVIDTVARLVAEVAGIVADPGIGEADIVRCLDRGLLAVAGAARLPDLATEELLSLEPGQDCVPVPADWQHGPTHAFLLPGRDRIRVLPNLAALRLRSAGRPRRGRICALAPSGGQLHVWPVPECPCSLLVGYFRLPDPLTGAPDKPLCLPPHLVGPLLVNYACRELFERLEEGVGDRKVQTTAYARRFDDALAELLAHYGPRQEQPVDVSGGPVLPDRLAEIWL